MRHKVAGRKLGRKAAHRKALLRELTRALLRHERIVTTEPKAKECRPYVEKLITLARKPYTLHRYRQAVDRLKDKQLTKKLFEELAPRFEERAGGYTRILKLGASRWESAFAPRWTANRLGDNATRVVFELVERPEEAGETSRRRAARKAEKKAKKARRKV